MQINKTKKLQIFQFMSMDMRNPKHSATLKKLIKNYRSHPNLKMSYQRKSACLIIQQT